MTWLSFYLIGFLIMFFLATYFLPYKDVKEIGETKAQYVGYTLIVSSTSWLGILILLYGAFARDE